MSTHTVATMSVECAHCGTRCPDGTTRCPTCLRTTHLEAVAAPSERPPRPRAVAALAGGILALLALAVVGLGLSRRHSVSPEAAVPAPPATIGPELTPVVERARAIGDRLGRARSVAESFQHRRVATVVGDDDPVSHPRAPDAVWRTMTVPGERVTQLDLARAIAAVLQAAGDAQAVVTLRQTASRADEPADPTGVLGSYGVAVGDSIVEVSHGEIIPVAPALRVDLDARRLAAVVSAQECVASATDGTRDRAVQAANAAVDQWTEGDIPLAARARVWMEVGGSSGGELADADLRAAMATHDTAPYRLARARVLLLQNRVGEAASEVVHALRLAPAWGDAALAAIAMRSVRGAQDAAAPPGCAALQVARVAWTDDAYALCPEGDAAQPEAVRAAAAGRMLQSAHDPLRVAYAAARSPNDERATLVARTSPGHRRETAIWLMLLGRPDLAGAFNPPERDAGR